MCVFWSCFARYDCGPFLYFFRVLSLSCRGLVVSTCQAIGSNVFSDETSSEWRKLSRRRPGWRVCSVVLSGTILITLLVVVRLQVLGDPCAMPVGERRISAMFYDVRRDQLLTASTVIDVLPLTRAVHDIAQLPRTHDRPLAVVSCCPVFCSSLLTSASPVRYNVVVIF